MDREKVIKELESLRDICNAKSNMAIGKGKVAWAGYANTADDAIALLKEQEAVEPQTQPSAKGYWFTCGACGWWLFDVRDTVHFDDRKRIRFCASCGRAVKWE